MKKIRFEVHRDHDNYLQMTKEDGIFVGKNFFYPPYIQFFGSRIHGKIYTFPDGYGWYWKGHKGERCVMRSRRPAFEPYPKIAGEDEHVMLTLTEPSDIELLKDPYFSNSRIRLP